MERQVQIFNSIPAPAKTAQYLCWLLDCPQVTTNHIQIINKFIKHHEKDCTKLLDQLGTWNALDLALTELWMKL